MKSNKQQSFIKGAFILVAAYVVVKVINAGFKIPLANLIGEDGMGLFNGSYQIYTFLFIVATAGFPVAISKMVAESLSHNNRKDAQKVFETAFILLAAIGLAGSAFLFFFAKNITNAANNPKAYLGVMAIAPAVFFV